MCSRKSEGSFSQYAEDLYIDNLMNYADSGFYVDIGANHPVRFSNTKRFYDRGWRGINVEPDLNNYKEFVRARPRDVNLNIGVGCGGGEMTFYVFSEDSLSTFSREQSELLQRQGHKLIEEKKISMMKLSDILRMHAKGIYINFISVDTEGYDLEVLRSNDWGVFRPRVVCVEDRTGADFSEFFGSIGYRRVAYNGLNSFYVT